LLKIIDIQKILQLSNFNIGSSYFYLGIIYFFTKKFELSEKALKISQKLSTPLEFELNNEHFLIKKREFDIPEKNEKNQIIPYKISLKKSSDILRVLAEIYLLKKEYIKAINCIENAYYLYFESYGSNYGYTIFLRKNNFNFRAYQKIFAN
jgi:tetratricopeptide (TPR) repeat protein